MFKKGTHVLITNRHRGIYYGVLESDYDGGNEVIVTGARHVFSYTRGLQNARGTFSLSTHGPQSGSKLSPAIKRLLVRDVCNVAECQPTAIDAFETGGWV